MNILTNLFLFNKKSEKNKDFSAGLDYQYLEIAKLVKEARMQQNLTIKQLSYNSKIPERIINSIENNNKNVRPKYPFIRSILIKLEECLVLKKNTLLKLAVKELSCISKIPERIINSIENNNKNTRPEYPFIRSILIKLEECLVLKKNTLLNLAVKERKILKKKGKDFMFRKFDLINTWQGSILYFFILVLTLFILKRYFVLNVNVIENQNIENQIVDK